MVVFVNSTGYLMGYLTSSSWYALLFLKSDQVFFEHYFFNISLLGC
jgi:hypothetical protein